MNGEFMVGLLVLSFFLLIYLLYLVWSYIWYLYNGKQHGWWMWSEHDWRYETDYHRICTVCGETQESSAGEWDSKDFDRWKNGASQRKSEIAKKASQKQKAQQYVQSLTNQEEGSG